MSSRQATVSKILTYSCVDGPGNRLVVFLQGCNFNCPACHNPHTVGICNDCGDCVDACHVNALSLVDGKIVFDQTNCDQCDACLDACPISANPMVQKYSVDEILDIARDNLAFLSGVTVSGGEATLQIKFIMDLFGEIKSDPMLGHLTCFIDTNGHLGRSSWDKLLPLTDGVMLDIKAFDQELHKNLTGQKNDKSLQSAHILKSAGKLYELRYLMIPEHTDSDAEIGRLIDFVHSIGLDTRIKLNAFQHHGVKGEALEWPKMPETSIDETADQLKRAGITNVITPAIYF